MNPNSYCRLNWLIYNLFQSQCWESCTTEKPQTGCTRQPPSCRRISCTFFLGILWAPASSLHFCTGKDCSCCRQYYCHCFPINLPIKNGYIVIISIKVGRKVYYQMYNHNTDIRIMKSYFIIGTTLVSKISIREERRFRHKCTWPKKKKIK